MLDCLIRFKDPAGKVHYGEGSGKSELIGATVPVYAGDAPWDLRATKDQAQIAEILCPLAETPIIYGIGLNYKHHIAESGFPTPKYPIIFTKPPDALAGPYDDVPVSPDCQNLDYEGELCVVVGTDFKDLSARSDPLDYILGFTTGNDVSSRFWQAPQQSGNQHGYAKSFDKFAPIGPAIVSPRSPAVRGKLADGTLDLQLVTRVNGEERQKSSTADLLFGLGDIMRHLSRATTVRRGTVIMTGTPSGVAAFLDPPVWLTDGDVVEITIEGIGAIRNKMAFQQK